MTANARPDPKAHLLAEVLALVERGEAQAAALVRVVRGERAVSHHPLNNLWQAPLPRAVDLLSLEEMVARIDAVRLEEAPDCCPRCGSTVALATLTLKWCPSCRSHQPRHGFYADRAQADGLDWRCKPCRNAASKADRVRRALRVVRRPA